MFHQAEMIPRFMGYSYSNPKHGDVIPRKHLPWTLRNWLDIMARIEPIQWADNKPANIHTYIYTYKMILYDIYIYICIVTYSYIFLTVNYERHNSHFLWLHPNCSCLNHPFSSPNCGGGSPCAKQHTIAAGRLDGRARRPLPLLEPWLQIAD